MLTDLCQELKNWFDRGQPKFTGSFSIRNNDIFITYNGTEKSLSELGLATNQYFRVIGSVFNDGVIKYAGADMQQLTSEVFNGAVWFMAIPPAVVSLSSRIDAWQDKYGNEALSPFTSESFGGYSYSKGTASSSNGGSGSNTWQGAFKSELNKWRKL